MKRLLEIITICTFLAINATAQRKMCIDKCWSFFLGDGSAAIQQPEHAKAWRTLDLPHDWSVESEAANRAGGTVVGPFSTNSIGGYQTGYTVGGEGWYLKKLHIDKNELKDSRFELYFEGVYNQAEVYVNGSKFSENVYGYCSFKFDVTKGLLPGDNYVLVKAVNQGNNSRWYAGSGIYRHVWLIKTPMVYADEWETFVQTPDKNHVTINTAVFNSLRKKTKVCIDVELIDPEGNVVAMRKTNAEVGPQDFKKVDMNIDINKPRLWNTEDPYLYKAVIKVNDTKNNTTDVLVMNFGVRTIEFNATQGFILNGENTLLRGGCIHHDNGLLGAAAYDRAETRKLQLMKEQGYNAVRCSHNMPSEHFLDACDSLGILVIDEAFDQWIRKKNNEDYHRFFNQHSTQDVQTMVKRDRNHPSVIMWSIGNEIPGRIEPEGMEAAERLRTAVRQYDQSRPITAAICGWDEGDEWNAKAGNWTLQDEKAFKSLDVGGYNYMYGVYVNDHNRHPDRVMFGAESFPKQASQNWDLVEKYPFVIGDFVWTAIDYLGEAGIGSAAFREQGGQSMFQQWPWFNGWCGDIDIIGQKKPQSYYRDVIWRQKPITMAVEMPAPKGAHMAISGWGWQLEQQDWTFDNLTENDTLNVNVYSRAKKVRLYLNDMVIGEQHTTDTYWTGFRVPYIHGTLKAVNIDNQGNEIKEEFFILKTTGKTAGLRLTADLQTIHSDGNDLAYVTIEAIDKEGNVVISDSQTIVNISVEGEGSLLASGNASPTDMESFRNSSPRLFNGRALAIIKGNGKTGDVLIKVTSNNKLYNEIILKII